MRFGAIRRGPIRNRCWGGWSLCAKFLLEKIAICVKFWHFHVLPKVTILAQLVHHDRFKEVDTRIDSEGADDTYGNQFICTDSRHDAYVSSYFCVTNGSVSTAKTADRWRSPGGGFFFWPLPG